MLKLQQTGKGEILNILVIGNNPIELGVMLSNIQSMKERQVVVEFAFDLQSILERLSRFQPHVILIDDNIGKIPLQSTVKALAKERKTKNIPITILKNSNYVETIGSGVLDFILKGNLTADLLYHTLLNSIKIRKTQEFLYKSYKRRKGQLRRLFRNEPSVQI